MTTHAITIDAPAERIWRWLVQIGQERAGFYSDSAWWDKVVDFYYHVLSREQGRTRVRYQKRDTNIVSDWQELHTSDAILDGPPGTAYYVVRQLAPITRAVLGHAFATSATGAAPQASVRRTDRRLPAHPAARRQDGVHSAHEDGVSSAVVPSPCCACPLDVGRVNYGSEVHTRAETAS